MASLQVLVIDDEPAIRQMLTLMLMRKKAVVVEGSEQREGVEVMTVRVPPSDDVHEVRAVEIDEPETERLREELGRLFQLGGRRERGGGRRGSPGRSGTERTGRPGEQDTQAVHEKIAPR